MLGVNLIETAIYFYFTLFFLISKQEFELQET